MRISAHDHTIVLSGVFDPSYVLSFDSMPSNPHVTVGFRRHTRPAHQGATGTIAPQGSSGTYDLQLRARGLTPDQLRKIVKALAS